MKHLVIPAKDDTVQVFLQAFEDKLKAREAFNVEIKGAAVRSLDQNALFHVWCRDVAAYFYNIPAKKVDGDIELEAIKISLKRQCYNETGWSFILVTKVDALTGEEAEVLQTTRKYGKGEMFDFMNWVQVYVSNEPRFGNMILKSTGEYQMLTDSQYT